MSRVLSAGFALAIALACLAGACGKGSGVEPSDTSDQQSGQFSSDAPPGEPSQLDFARLSASFGQIGAQALQQSLPGGSTSLLAPVQEWSVAAAPLLAPQPLSVPDNETTVDLPFLCCSGTATSVTVRGTVGGAGSSTSVPVSLQLVADGPLQWSSSNGGTTWNLSFIGNVLTLSGNLTAANGTIVPGQELRLDGTLRHVAAGTTKIAPVSLTLRYQDLATGIATASGTIGPLQIAGTSLPTITSPERCSRPQEGCGPTVQGQCPCTKFVVCPSYGISCGPR